MSEWKKVCLGDLVTIRTGKRDANFGSPDGAYPFFTCARQISRCQSYSFDCDAILLAGNCDISNMQRYCGKFEAYQRTYVLTNKDDSISDLDYIWNCLRRDWVKVTFGKMLGAAIQYIKLGMIKEFPIALPPLSTQKHIADILSAYDDLIENNRRRVEILEESARLIFKERFGEEDATGVLADICEEIRRAVKPSDVAVDTPYIGLEHMPRRSISLCQWEGAGKVTSTKHGFNEGEILFGKIRPYFHKVGLAFVDGVASSDAIVIRPLKAELRNYVLLTVSSDDFVAAASQGMKEGSKMPRADWGLLLKYPVPIPAEKTLANFNQLIEPIMQQLKALCFTNRKLAEARDVLLPKLMNETMGFDKGESK